MGEQFADGDAYERFMGRWSRPVARELLARLAVPPGSAWADVGCGSGALSQAVLDTCDPRSVVGLDPSPGQVEVARRTVPDPRARFVVAGAQDLLDALGGPVDAVVCGLVLNFVSDAAGAVALMRRAAPGGQVAAYLWDSTPDGPGMPQLQLFAEAAAAVVPTARQPGGGRSALEAPAGLEALWRDAGLTDVAVRAVDVPLAYRDRDELWGLYLLGVGPPGQLLAGLDVADRERLRTRLLGAVPVRDDGSVRLTARAWTVSGRA